MRIALRRVLALRDRHGLRSRIVNQIHDALLCRVPMDEVDRMTQIVRAGMGGIPIPMPDGSTLALDVDIEYFSRWGDKAHLTNLQP